MTVIPCELDDDVAKVLVEVSAKQGVDAKTLAGEILTGFARREEFRSKALSPEVLKLAAEFAEEDRQLAEQGMADYAAGLEREDMA